MVQEVQNGVINTEHPAKNLAILLGFLRSIAMCEYKLDYELAAKSLMAPENEEWRDIYFKESIILKLFINETKKVDMSNAHIRIPMS